MSYLDLCASHLNRIIRSGVDKYGPKRTQMWVSALDPETGRYPNELDVTDQVETEVSGCSVFKGKRVYRNIDAPRGSSLYWDQPQIVAAYLLSDEHPEFKVAVDGYITDFLDNCVSKNGLFLWGNHYYYDVYQDATVRFVGDEPPAPCLDNEEGELHELRPIMPAAELFWQTDSDATDKYITALERHIFDPETGGFNRHADKKSGCAFLESGGILVHLFCQHYKRTSKVELFENALKIARYSFSHKNSVTRLLEVNPTENRWDKYTCTTEVGLWAGQIIQAYRSTNHKEFLYMAESAIDAYLQFGFDETSQKFYGRLNVSDGTANREQKSTPFQPDTYSNIYEPLFPTHDYLLPMGECIIELYSITKKHEYLTAISRIYSIIKNAGSKIKYAEHYGRIIHFLLSANRFVNSDEYIKTANEFAESAVAGLYRNNMFVGHTGAKYYQAVDGVGYLLLSLIYLDTGRKPDCYGLSF